MSFNQFPNYQCLDEGTQGEPGKANRSIPDRVKDYGLLNYITKESTVLDLGCNRGYFGVYLADKIKSYYGIDTDSNQIMFGIAEAQNQNLTNLTYRNDTFLCLNNQFDIILCLAFHSYVNMSMWELAKCLIDMLKPGGHLLLEGHPKGYRDEPEKYFNPLASYLNENLKQVERKQVKDRELLRPFIIFKK